MIQMEEDEYNYKKKQFEISVGICDEGGEEYD